MLNAVLVQLRLANFDDSYVLRRGKYARFLGLSLKTYEMNIQAVSCLKTQMQSETFAKKWKKISDMDWAQDIKIGNAQNL